MFLITNDLLKSTITIFLALRPVRPLSFRTLVRMKWVSTRFRAFQLHPHIHSEGQGRYRMKMPPLREVDLNRTGAYYMRKKTLSIHPLRETALDHRPWTMD